MQEEQQTQEQPGEVAEETQQTAPVVEEAPKPAPSRGAIRNEQLSGKVKIERDKAEEAITAQQTAEVERDFYKGFSETTSKYPQAAEHSDAILEKVKAGYPIEDATVSVLNSEGKLIPQKEDKEVVAGGSATTNPPDSEKPSSDMSQADIKEELIKRGVNMDDIKKIHQP